jgi:hypothetical protein
MKNIVDRASGLLRTFLLQDKSHHFDRRDDSVATIQNISFTTV